MDIEWTDLGPADLADGDVQLRKTAAGQRLVCLQDRGTVQVLDDRCPHQGYPLSQGTLRDGALTCAWHNWKFDVCSGTCTTGGDAVKRFPSRVRDGRIEADLSVDVEAEARRARAGISAGLFDDDPARALRDGLRLAALPGHDMRAAFLTLVEDAARRNRWGFGHELAAVTDLLGWVQDGDLDEVEAFTVAVTWVGDRLAREPARAEVPAAPSTTPLSTLLDVEDHHGAEASARWLARESGALAATKAMLPFASSAILDYGHGAIYLAKAYELCQHLPEATEAVMGAVAVNLSWATKETALPPWAATRRALGDIEGLPPGPGALGTAASYETAVLEGERSAVQATVAHLREGIGVQPLLHSIATAATTRLCRFDPDLAGRPDLDASVLDVSHLVTYADAALALLPLATHEDAMRLAVLAAGFVGKLSGADRAEAHSRPEASDLEGLLGAIYAREPARAAARSRSIDHTTRRDAFRRLRPFAALDAFVRPIFAIHAVKGLEALDRIDRARPDVRTLEAYASLAGTRWTERALRRTAATARQFLADGRPPRGLY